MQQTVKLIAAIALATMAVPAMAGSWPNLPAAGKAAGGNWHVTAPASRDGFVETSGDATASLEQYSYTFERGTVRSVAPRLAGPQPAKRVATASPGGFEYVGGDSGWQPASHRLVWVSGRFVHSDECDHAIRTAEAATSRDIERMRTFSPGA